MLSQKYLRIRNIISFALLASIVIKVVMNLSGITQNIEYIILIPLFFGWAWFVKSLMYEESPRWEKEHSFKKIWFLIGVRWFYVLCIWFIGLTIVDYLRSGGLCGGSVMPFIWWWQVRCNIFEYFFHWMNGFITLGAGLDFLMIIGIMFLTWVMADFFVTRKYKSRLP